MISHSLTRRRGGARVTLDDFARWRTLSAAGSPSTLPQVAVDAMLDPDGVTGVVDVTFELESNRTGRPVVTTVVGGLALKDPAIMDLADLASGRKRPSQNVCIADASYADASSVWPSSGAAALDEYPVGVASAGYVLLRNIVEPKPIALGANVTWTMTDSNGLNPVTQIGIDPGDAGRLTAASEGRIYKASPPNAQTWLLYATFASNNPATYKVGPDGTRTFTVVTKLNSSIAAQVTPYVYAVVGGTPGVFTSSSPTRSVAPAAGLPGFTRIVTTVTVTGAPGADIAAVSPYVAIAVGAAARLEYGDVQVYAGAERPDSVGVDTGHPTAALGFEQQFTGGARKFSRLEVTGHEGSIPTAVYVETWNGAAWVPLAVGSATIVFPAPVVATGLRVYVEETTGYGGALLLNEIDASYVLTLDGETTGGIVAASTQWAREADPGQVASPFGNYQTSTLELELDNSAGMWSPEANVNLDVGHRITAAFGVRYTNLCPNPRGDIDASSWTLDVAAGSTVGRATSPYELGPTPPGKVGSAIAIRMPAATGALAYLYSEFTAASPGDVFEVGAWIRNLLLDPAAAGIAVAAITYHSSTVVKQTSVLQRTNVVTASAGLTGDRWTYGRLQATAPAGTVAVRIEFTAAPQTSPSSVALITRATLRKIEAGLPVVWETLIPAGVFYSDPFDFNSDDATVSISASDRLGRNADVALNEGVRIGHTVGAIVVDLANQVLDLGPDQVAVGSNVASYLIPYAAPASNAGGYFADLAKCVAGSLYVDALERLTLVRRDTVTPARVAEIRADNALVRYRRPAGYDLTTSAVKLSASPLTTKTGLPSEVWAMPSGGFQVPAASTKTLVANYSIPGPVVAPFLTGIVADLGGVTYTPTFYSDYASIDIVNPNGTTVTVADARIQGTELVQNDLTTLVTDAPSAKRYGNRTLEIEARLIQSQSQLETTSQVLLDAFRALDSNGLRRLPDLILEGMGLPHVEGGDRVLVTNPRTGLGEDFAVLSRRLGYSGAGELLMSDVRVRQSPDVIFMISDVHLADDVSVAGA